jgi:hypothetical protein
MWTVVVVVGGLLPEYRRQMAFTGDENPVGALAANRAHPSAPRMSSLGRLRRSPDHGDALGGEHRVEGGRELTIRATNMERSSM